MRLSNIFKSVPITDRVFTSIYELPLANFLDVVCDKNLEALTKPKEKATVRELETIWNKIYEEYVNSIKDKDAEYIVKARLKVEDLRRKVYIVTLCANGLRGWRTVMDLKGMVVVPPEFAESIQRESGYRGKFDITDKVQFEKDIQMAEAFVKRYEIEMEEKQYEIDVLLQKNKGEGVTRQSFMATLARMSRWANVHFNPKEISVFEFVSNLNDWKKEIEQTAAANKRRAKT